eukprot:PhM_4_TR10801/c0_g3_i1/m.52595/K16457/CEP76; centrosomal protein CEP76
MLQKVLGSFDVTKALPSAPGDGIGRRTVTGTERLLTQPGQPSRYIHAQILGGRAFLDNLFVDVRMSNQYRMYCQLHFGSQRFRTSMVEFVCEPPFDEDFVINMDQELLARKIRDPVALNVPLHVVVLRYDTATGLSSFVGENTVEWRKALPTGRVSFSVELGSGNGIGASVGVLNLDLNLLGNATVRHTEDDVAQYLASERTHVTASEREFVLYAKRWWNEFQSLHPLAAQRKIKVFVGIGSNAGIQMVPITSLVQPLQTGRLLSSPMEAARFVSLIAVPDTPTPRSTDSCLSGGDTSVTMSQLAFLCTRQGDTHNMAILLCGLFLGFGLDAYCATGTRHDAPSQSYMWVITRSTSGVTFWDPASGRSSKFTPAARHGVFSKVWSCFNHTSFYANAQEDDGIEVTSFEFMDDRTWKPMNPVKLRLVAHHVPVPLLPCTLNALDVESRVEDSLVQLISEHRARLGLPVAFDSDGSYLLAQALVSYEAARCTGAEMPSLHADLFQSAIRQCIPEGHTFKAYPLSTTHTSSSRILHALTSNPTGKEIIECTGDDVRFMVRVKCTTYPDEVVSVWAMIAVRYRATHPSKMKKQGS